MTAYGHTLDLESRFAEVAHPNVLFHRVVVVQTEDVEVPLDPSTWKTLGVEKVHHVVLVETRRVLKVGAHGVGCENSFYRKVIQFYDVYSMNAFTKIQKETHRFVKTLKRSKPCETFCKKDYGPMWDKGVKQLTGKRTRSGRKFSYDVCRKTFCNPMCQGYPVPIRHKKGFQKEYTPAQVERFQQRGALSGCVYIDPKMYNVFH